MQREDVAVCRGHRVGLCQVAVLCDQPRLDQEMLQHVTCTVTFSNTECNCVTMRTAVQSIFKVVDRSAKVNYRQALK
jgi:hypothetical protein